MFTSAYSASLSKVLLFLPFFLLPLWLFLLSLSFILAFSLALSLFFSLSLSSKSVRSKMSFQFWIGTISWIIDHKDTNLLLFSKTSRQPPPNQIEPNKESRKIYHTKFQNTTFLILTKQFLICECARITLVTWNRNYPFLGRCYAIFGPFLGGLGPPGPGSLPPHEKVQNGQEWANNY